MEIQESYNQIKNEINKSLEDTHLMLLVPKLFISNYFGDLKAELDAYFIKNNQNETNKWKNLINKIETYENDYYKKCTLNDTFKEKIKLEIDNIKERLSNDKLNKVSSIKYYEELKELTNHIEYKVQKNLLSNKSFIFLDTVLNHCCSEKISLLLIINDAFVRKSKIIYFDSETNPILLTNEMTKIIYLFVKLNKNDNNDNHLLEISLNIDSIKELRFNRLKINGSEDDAFDGFESLNNLHLYGNLINSLNQVSFKSLKRLEKLDLSNNEIEAIEPFDLLYLKQVTNLSISNNQIKTIHNHAFKEFENLKQLDLDGNLLTEIDIFTYAELVKLERLYLKENKISRIEEKSFEKLGQLKHLNLTSNNLGPCLDMSLFQDLSNLTELAIGTNQISSVVNSGGELNNLSWISLSDNSITSISENAFIGLTNLNCLYLNNNKLTILNGFVKSLTNNLKHLDLSDNLIAEIEKDVFKDLCSLQVLKLEMNKLTSIEHEWFSNLKDLTFLNLSYNSLKSLHLKEMINLKNLKLHKNELEHLKLESLDRLKILNLSHNPIKDLRSVCDLNLNELVYSHDQIDLINWKNSKIKFISSF